VGRRTTTTSRKTEGKEENKNNNRDRWCDEAEMGWVGGKGRSKDREENSETGRGEWDAGGAARHGEQQSKGISVGLGRASEKHGRFVGRASAAEAMSAGDGLGTPLYRWLYG
jgi:hypothetical protein